MASDEKKTKPNEKSPPKEKAGVSTPAKEEAVEAPTDAKSGAPKNYSRGEGQKAVTQAYKDNWNAIFGKKKKR
jgi:hypothetical protein